MSEGLHQRVTSLDDLGTCERESSFECHLCTVSIQYFPQMRIEHPEGDYPLWAVIATFGVPSSDARVARSRNFSIGVCANGSVEVLGEPDRELTKRYKLESVVDRPYEAL